MNIDMNSWHYRFNKWFLNNSGTLPQNLCPYFWATVGRLGIISCLIGGVTLIAFLSGIATMIGIQDFGLTNIIGNALESNSVTLWMYPVFVIVGAMTIAISFLLSVGAIFIMTLISSGINSLRNNKYKGLTIAERLESSDNLVIAFLSSKHKKVCPTLNFTRGEKK